MRTYDFRAIADGDVWELLEFVGLTLLDRRPYWKMEGFEELSGEILTDLDLQSLQSQFAEGWELNTAQRERSRIFCPGVYFLWVHE